MIKLSVVIITLNEETKIGRCLESLSELADEIIIIDSYSTDKTEEVCQKLKKLKFIKHKFIGHIEQKNFALEQAKFDHILSIDADEVLSPKLHASILAVKKNWVADCYSFNRLTNYAGHWVKHCGWYPDKKLRLIKKTSASWKGINPHDILTPSQNAQVAHLDGDLLHYSYDSISEHIAQTNNFTTISSIADYKRGVRVHSLKPIMRGIVQFFRDYFLKLGFLDGHTGLVICTINSMAYFLKFEKIYEQQLKKKLDKHL